MLLLLGVSPPLTFNTCAAVCLSAAIISPCRLLFFEPHQQQTAQLTQTATKPESYAISAQPVPTPLCLLQSICLARALRHSCYPWGLQSGGEAPWHVVCDNCQCQECAQDGLVQWQRPLCQVYKQHDGLLHRCACHMHYTMHKHIQVSLSCRTIRGTKSSRIVVLLVPLRNVFHSLGSVGFKRGSNRNTL